MKISTIALLLSMLFTLSVAKVTQEQLSVSYVYKLSKNIEWDNTKKTFSIHLVSSDKSLNKEFKELAKNIKLDGKKIIITTSRDEKIEKGSDVVYITQKKSHLYKKIFQRTKNYPILLISNDYGDKKLVMINLFTEKDKTMNFEINRANILSKGLGIKPDIILLGGTELDVAYLYRDTRDNLSSKEVELQKSNTELSKSKKNLEISKVNLQNQKKKLSLMKNEVAIFKKKNSELKSKIKDKEIILNKTKKEIKKYNEDVKELKKIVLNRNTKIKTQETKLSTLSKEFKKTKEDLKDIQSSLDMKIKKLQEQESLLKTQIAKVSKKEKYLEELEEQIDKKTQEFQLLKDKVAQQNKLLVTHERTIDIQKDYLWIALISLVVFLFIVLLISYLLKKQSKTNALLETTQEELRVAIGKADNASLNKSKFLASMSHELRTPLNAVLGYSQLLQRDTTFSDKHQKTFATIRNSGEHLLGLINDILLISKMEAGHIEVNNKSANIYELIDSMYAMFLLKTDKKAISLKSVISDNLPKYLLIDIDKVRQIMINLLNNAVKFTKAGEIIIYADYKDGNLYLSIKDTGAGVAPDEIDKLFKQYEQTKSGIDEGNGTGLGLALVQEFVNLFDGKVSVSSALDEGSTFKVIIPCVVSDEIKDDKKLKHIIKIAPNQKALDILIVDDIDTNRDLLAELLNVIGFRTVEQVNGLEAVKWVENNTPDLIFMDLRMPVMGGREATLKILEMNNNIPIIAITASILEMEELMETPYPFVDAIPKPFNETELLHLISKHIDVTYEYEADEVVVGEIEEISLMNLPSKEKDELLQATKSMNITSVKRILEKFDSSYDKEVDYMQNLVSDFNFEKLKLMLTE